jgi:hypothetical protein
LATLPFWIWLWKNATRARRTNKFWHPFIFPGVGRIAISHTLNRGHDVEVRLILAVEVVDLGELPFELLADPGSGRVSDKLSEMGNLQHDRNSPNQ